MQLVKSSINRQTGKGDAVLIPKDGEDIWHLYNLIRPGDVVRATARRKVVTEARGSAADSHGATQSRSVTTQFSVLVVKLDYDGQAEQLHVAGRICEQNPYAEMWAHHTLDLQPDRKVTLTKGSDIDAPSLDTRRGGAAADADVAGDSWDSWSLELLKMACDPKRMATGYIIIMDAGIARIIQMTEHHQSTVANIKVTLTGKASGAEKHRKSVQKFYEDVYVALKSKVDIPAAVSKYTGTSNNDAMRPPPLIVASPGFYASSFVKFMADKGHSAGDKQLETYANQYTTIIHTSSGYEHALDEIMKDPTVAALHADKRFARATVVMDRLQELLRADDGRAWYGPREVELAVDQGAVGRGGGVLLISDSLFRSVDVPTRRKWNALRDRVAQVEGGEVEVLTSSHSSGKQLEALGGVAAILTYALPDLDEFEEDEAEVNGKANGLAHDDIEPNRNLEIAV